MAQETKTREVVLPPLSRKDFYTLMLRIYYHWTKLTPTEETVLAALIVEADKHGGYITTEVKRKVQFSMEIVNLGRYIKVFKDKELIHKERKDYRLSGHLRFNYDEFKSLTFKFQNENYRQEHA